MERYKNRLRDLREDKDLTQAEVAKIFFLQPTQYRRYENGETDLPSEWTKKFAHFYNVSADYILGLISTPKKLDFHIGISEEKQKRLLKAYSDNPELQKAIDKILDIEE